MKGLKRQAVQISIILLFISCASYRSIQLINLTTKESPSETEIILTTSEPVRYKDTKLENPPCLIINFPEDSVISNEKEELVVNRGPVKKIKNEYYQNEGKAQRQLNFVIVELTQETPYKILNSGSSIIIRMENPKMENPKQPPSPAQPKIENEPPKTEPGYLIGPGDVLHVEVWKHPDITRDVIVNFRGEIRVPPIRKLSVIGLTPFQLEEKLTETLSEYFIDPIVFITVKEYNSQRVIALGETTTGMYTLKRKTTLVELLGEIGGTTANADIHRIKLIKKDGTILTYDLNELIKDRKRSDEIVVSGGDTVFVPPFEINKVYVLGEVRDPKVINIREKLNVVDAITEAGGYTRDAVTKSVMIIRGELGTQKGIRVNLSRILKKGDIGQNIDLKPGDIVYVPKSFIVDVERFLRDLSLPLLWYFWYLR